MLSFAVIVVTGSHPHPLRLQHQLSRGQQSRETTTRAVIALASTPAATITATVATLPMANVKDVVHMDIDMDPDDPSNISDVDAFEWTVPAPHSSCSNNVPPYKNIQDMVKKARALYHKSGERGSHASSESEKDMEEEVSPEDVETLT